MQIPENLISNNSGPLQENIAVNLLKKTLDSQQKVNEELLKMLSIEDIGKNIDVKA